MVYQHNYQMPNLFAEGCLLGSLILLYFRPRFQLEDINKL